MKNNDKNSLIGFLLIAFILIIFNVFFFPESQQQNAAETSQNNITKNEVENNEILEITNKIKKGEIINEQLRLDYGIFADAAIGEQDIYILENEKMKVTFSNKGGRIISVILKEYQTYDSLDLDIYNADSSRFNLQFTTGKNINTEDLYFEAEQNQNTISMKLKASDQNYIEYLYSISEDYMLEFDINLIGMESLIPPNVNYMTLDWQMKTPKTEKSKDNQDMYTGIQYQYLTDKEVDYLSFSSDDKEKINARLNWVAFKQQFFSAIFIAENGFEKPTILSSSKSDKSKFIKNLEAQFEIPFQHKKNEQLNYKFYFGPNHYKTLKSYESGFEELIPLGWGIFGWVNKYIIIPIFDFLSKFGYNYGIIILLLTIIIKIALSPFTYKAFLSQAKMKVLKPEIDKLTEKTKDKDPMKAQQATMALYRKAGVNPMGGCLPMLFQFPILIAMFRFFPASIELRQQSFLWADDLSTYDSIYDLGFNIPFYGDHISLFTLLMTISTLLYTKMNSSMATGQMAQMKWMMYLMPIMFLGFFNNYAAGLSYYYFLANMFTFTQQYFMKNLINENAILAEIEANKKRPPKPKSKFQKKLEAMQKEQERKMKKRNK